MQPDQTLFTKRLVLRPPIAGDAAAIVAALGDWEVTRWLARVPFPYRLEDAIRFLNWERTERPRSRDRVFAIDRDGMIGMISLRDYGSQPVLGYWIVRSEWGHGYMSEAVDALLQESFVDPRVMRLQSGVFEGNERSLAIQKRFGFEIIGRSRQHNLALGQDLAHIDTILTRKRHQELKR
jgi:RimJ/RimL family protein N-acetyltransferase